MHELLGRLQQRDPQASAELRIIAHFDALASSHVGLEGLLRAAVTLAGCPAGFRDNDTVLVIDDAGGRHDGRRGDDLLSDPHLGDANRRPCRTVPGSANTEVWLARQGGPRQIDEMIIERLALAVATTEQRRAARIQSPLLTVIDSEFSEAERRAAMAALRIAGQAQVRMVALPAQEPAPPGMPSTLITTPTGSFRGVLQRDHLADPPEYRRAGLGCIGQAMQLPISWRSAVTALKIGGTVMPVVDADVLGILAVVADAQLTATHHDRHRLASMVESVSWTASTVEALVLSGSQRAAATALGIHHATLQGRVGRLRTGLGYDVTQPLGSHRLAVSFLAYKLS